MGMFEDLCYACDEFCGDKSKCAAKEIHHLMLDPIRLDATHRRAPLTKKELSPR